MNIFPPRFKKLIAFLAAGGPAFLLAVPGNYALVEWAGLHKSLAYAIMLVTQVSINYFMCRAFVFEKKSTTKWYHEFAAFLAGISFIRLLDWCLYVVLVEYVGVYYIAAQILNVLIFSVVKFLFSERILK